MSTARSARRRTRAARGAFTLVELLLVMVILAALAAIIVPRFAGRAGEARVTASGVDLAGIGQALDMFEVNCGRYPTTSEGLAALLEQPSGVSGWKGPYLKIGQLPKDKWGNLYQYRCPGTHNNDYDLWSFGPDGQEGGGDDIDNWSQK